MPLVLLDEPSSNLDPEHEESIRQAMARLAKGRTVILVAHQLRTVYHADQIVVFDGGRVVETGTHESLLRRDGLYRGLVLAYEGIG